MLEVKQVFLIKKIKFKISNKEYTQKSQNHHFHSDNKCCPVHNALRPAPTEVI